MKQLENPPQEAEYRRIAASTQGRDGGLHRPSVRAQPVPAAFDSPPWPPPLEAAAFHGLAGDVVAVIRPHTEADEAALLINFLVAFGSAVGRGPHTLVEDTRHGCNLSTVLVGETAKARKGTAWNRINPYSPFGSNK